MYISRIVGFLTLILFSLLSPVTAQDQSSELRKSVKQVKDMISFMEIYDQLDKKRLYGAVSRKGAIEFKIKSSPLEKPTSMVVGIATDGTIQEMVIKVYTTNATNEKIRQVRKDIVKSEKDWVFEIMDSSQNYLIDIQVNECKRDIALVEVVHGFFYGHQSTQTFSSGNQKTDHPSSHAPKQDGSSLAPIDVYNSFEMFRKSLWD